MENQKLLSNTNSTPESEFKLIKYDPGIFGFDSEGIYLHKLFYCWQGTIPSRKWSSYVDTKIAKKWIENNLSKQIVQTILQEKLFFRDNRSHISRVVYLLKEGIIIDINCGELEVYYKTSIEFEAQVLYKALSKLKGRISKASVNLIKADHSSFSLTKLNNAIKKTNLSENYNDDLIPQHATIVKQLKERHNSGLVLLYGKPGTGKSTYLRHLISFTKKKVIIISSKLTKDLDDPNVISVLLNNPNSILVIEDAEELIVSRERERNSDISLLLNLTDGILGDSLGIQVICTFNTELKNIDKALLRKGRLIARYEFKELSLKKTNHLLKKLHKENIEVNKPMTLTDIYNYKESCYEIENQKNQIGFKQNQKESKVEFVN